MNETTKTFNVTHFRHAYIDLMVSDKKLNDLLVKTDTALMFYTVFTKHLNEAIFKDNMEFATITKTEYDKLVLRVLDNEIIEAMTTLEPLYVLLIPIFSRLIWDRV